MTLKFLKNKNFALFKSFLRTYFISILIILVLTVGLTLSLINLNNTIVSYNTKDSVLESRLKTTSLRLNNLQNQNQYKINQALKENINDIQTSYKQAVDLYQQILDLQAQKQDTGKLDEEFSQSLEYLYKMNYSSASASLKLLSADIQKEQEAIATSISGLQSQNVQASNSLPSEGFSAQRVSVGSKTFLVYIVAANLNTTRVIVDTASSGDCSNNCPTLPLSDYVSRNNAFAGINGSFFCPADYPSCAGKTGSFDTLLMNKNKVYFNSANNVYSTVPLVVFKDNWAKFFTQSLQWGRDTSVDAVIAMQPLLIFSGQDIYSGSSVSKYNVIGTRDFIANKGNTIYIGVIFGASMDDAANVLKTLGVDNALNLDEGGSTALWYGGYKAGPGRNIPNAVLFVRK